MKFCFDCANLYEIETDICPFCGADTAAGAYPKEPYHLTPGTTLKGGKYLVGRAMGYGGFGVTYAALDTVLQRRVAIKEYLPSTCSTRNPGTLNVTVFNGDENSDAYIKGLQSFVNEADRLKMFRNFSGIVTIYDSFAENDTAYIVMELLDGQTLKAYLEEKGTLSFEESKRIIAPVLGALEYVHREGIIHRDISPENVFLCSNGEVKLLDFGAARYATANVSKSLSVILKPGYAPAEQYSSRGQQGPWSDVYAVGATMYKMLTGVTPDEALERASGDTLKPPSKLGVDIPKDAETALLNALNINHERRTRSAGEFLYELTGGQEVAVKEDDPRGVKPWALPKWVYAALACVLAAGGIFAALLLTGVISFKTGADTDVIVSDLVPVPELIGMTEEEALDAYRDYWNIRSEFREETDEFPEGCIIRQDPDFGELVSADERTIILTISAGPAPVGNAMPYLRGASLEEAREAVTEKGCTYVIEYDYDDTMVKGNVKTTVPESGAALHAGDEVTLIVSLGGLLSDVQIVWSGDEIPLTVGGEAVEIEYRVIPANVEEGLLTIEYLSYEESVASFSGSLLQPGAEGRTVIEVRASMQNELTGETVTVTDNRYAYVRAPEATPAPTASPTPRATSTATATPRSTYAAATPTPTHATATPYVATVSFRSAAFEAAFRQFAHKYNYISSQDAPITQEVINSVTTLDLRGSGLTDISDAAKFKYATSMVFSNNSITSLRPLYGMTRLTKLVIYNNPISEASIREFCAACPNCTVNSDYGTISSP